MRDRFLWTLLWLLPKNTMSRWMGRVAESKLPKPLNNLLLGWFTRRYGLNLDEAVIPQEGFGTLQALFTRGLKPGVRTIATENDAFVSPCDGAYGESGVVKNGLAFQVKGRPYTVGELLGDEALSKTFEGGDFVTLYLSPKDYHRFHAPATLQVRRAQYIPGQLWPVNLFAVQNIDRLFCVNERIIAYCETGRAEVEFAIVAVGATMVGKVHTKFDATLTTNKKGSAVTRQYDPAPRIGKGEEFGHFAFGSTLVLLAKKGVIELRFQQKGAPVKMGEKIGRFLVPGPA
jgi:phosphatidylserine decarboxylase